MADVYGTRGDFAQAEAEFEKALGLNPSSFQILVNYASWVSAFGRPEKGAEVADKAIRLNPNYPLWAAGLLRAAYFFAGRYEDAARIVERKPAETRNRNDLVLRAASYGALGRAEQARAAVQEALARFPGLTVEGFAVADTQWSPKERERLVGAMRAAGFPLCAAKEAVESTPDMTRLPECGTS